MCNTCYVSQSFKLELIVLLIQERSLCDLGGKTRTKDKYRVVYTDHQRLELEKEFQYNRYITMRRKTELSMALSLSERQVRRLE